jgi:PAS domain S-box-containing protein
MFKLVINAIFLFLLIIPSTNAADAPRFETVVELEKQTCCIIRDQDGFIWIGSVYGGLIKFNGLDIVAYKKEEGKLSSSSVSSLLEDHDGNIWIGTDGGGLNRYDKKTGKFTYYRHDPNDPFSLSSDSMPIWNSKLICLDRKGFLWVGTAHGLNRLDMKSGKFQRYFASGNPGDISSNSITAIVEDKNGNIWIGTRGGGLNKFNPSTQSFTVFLLDSKDANSLSDITIRSLMVDSDNTLWVGTESSGLNRLDKQKKCFIQYRHDPNNPKSIGGDTIFSLYEDQDKRIWVLHKMGEACGISVLNQETGCFERYSHKPEDPYSIKTHFIAEMCYDSSAKKTFLLYGNGTLDITSKLNKPFRLYLHEPHNSNSLSGNSVIPILEDRNGNMWLGTFTGGLNKYDPKTGKFTHYKHDGSDPSTIRSNYISALLEDKSGHLWLGSYGGSFSLFDPQEGKVLTSYAHDSSNPHSIMKGQMIPTIIQDRENPDYLWLAVREKGISRFDKKSKQVTNYPIKGISSVWYIYDDGAGSIWLPSIGLGLLQFDKAKGKVVKAYQHIEEDESSLGSNDLTYIHESRNGVFWISGLDGGLNKLDRKTEKNRVYSLENRRFPSNSLSGILEDNEGNLWIGTKDVGIVKFNPNTEEYQVYSKDDGLQADVFFQLSRYKTRSGEMWMGGIKGANSFYPNEIQANPYVPPVFITSLKQGGEPIKINSSLEHLQEIELGWRNNYFEFEFIALNYIHPKKNRYKYKLEGYDKEWFSSGTRHFGRYTHLSPGTYKLRVIGSNNDGVWNTDGASLKIVVQPPPWQSVWAYCLYLLSAAVIMVIIAAGFIKRTREQKRLRESEEKYRVLVENLPQMVFLKDVNSNYVSCNAKFAEDLGINPEDIAGKDDFAFFPAEQAEKYRADDRQIILEAKAGELEEPYQKGDEKRIVYTIKSPVLDKQGNVTGILGIFRDITEDKRIEAEQRMLEEQLIQSQKMDSLGKLAAGVAHDFNNMLAGIMGSADLIKSKYQPNPKSNEFLSIILNASKRAADLVNKLQIFSRKSVTDLVSLNIHDCNMSAIAILERSIDKRIEIKTNFRADSSKVKGDYTQLQNAILNLGINARDAMASGGTLTIDTENVILEKAFCNNSPFQIEPGAYIRISVKDTGTGIPFENQNKIFEPFFTTKPEGKGTGLGLASVFGTVSQHHGAIMLYSEEGRGTVFHIYMPLLISTDIESPVSLEKIEEPLDAGTGGILVIDDEEVVRSTACGILESNGYKTFSAVDGEDGLRVYQENQENIDLVLLDMVMPRLNGETTFYRLKDIDPKVRIILSSGFAQSSSIEKMQSDGLSGFVKKPYRQNVLLETIRKALKI